MRLFACCLGFVVCGLRVSSCVYVIWFGLLVWRGFGWLLQVGLGFGVGFVVVCSSIAFVLFAIWLS